VQPCSEDIRISMNRKLEQVSQVSRGMWKGASAAQMLSQRRISSVEPTTQTQQQQQQQEEEEEEGKTSSSSPGLGAKKTGLPRLERKSTGMAAAPTSLAAALAAAAWDGKHIVAVGAATAAAAAAKSPPEWMRLGMLGVGSHVGERALCTKRRHTYGAVARTPCTMLMLSHTDFKLRLSDKTHELMLSLTPKMPSVESVSRMMEQDERWRSWRAGIMEEALTVGKPFYLSSETVLPIK
jgi:hypothetical protein